MEGEAALAQFDGEVAARCELIRTNAETVVANLRAAVELALVGIPECVRTMPLKVLMERFNGDMQQAAAHFAPDVVAHGGEFEKRGPPTPPKAGLRGKHSAKQVYSTSENAAVRACQSPVVTAAKAHARPQGKSAKRT
jgi:hypothetical protein